MDVFEDERFRHVAKDPKFKNVPKKDHKVKIDRRFQGMFTDPKFKLDYSVDQRGRPIKHSQAEDYKKYYDLSEGSDKDSDSDEETIQSSANEEPGGDCISHPESSEVKKQASNDNKSSILQLESAKLSGKIVDRLQDLSVDYARGEGILDTDSSSSDEVTTDDSDEEIEHDWGELDKDADVIDSVTRRLALCHLDWDRVTATDIFVLLNSFLPPTGYIESVTIYPSEFGMQRMKEEEIKGPHELTSQQIQTNDDDELDEDDEYHREKLRQYQIKRLKYYYAVAVFNNADSANKVYVECDKVEYESSATRLDLRFIPDDMTFDQEPKEICTKMPENAKYKPRLFSNTALQQEKVELTWDETDPNRIELTRKISQGAHVPDADLKVYLATSSEESDFDQPGSQDDDNSDIDEIKSNKNSKEDEVARYRSLLAGIHKEEEEKKQGKVEMEISWDLALENKTKEMEEKQTLKSSKKKNKEKQSKKLKKGSDSDDLLSDDDLPSDIDMNDPYFKEEFDDNPKKKTKKSKSKYILQDDCDEEETKRKAELELLLADDEEEETARRHFNIKTIHEREIKKGKKKRKNNKQAEQEDDFKIDLKDERFSALFTSHLYNIDPADSHFKKTKAMDDIVTEKSRRRKLDHNYDYSSDSKKQRKDGLQLSSEITKLVTSIQKKSKIRKQDN